LSQFQIAPENRAFSTSVTVIFLLQSDDEIQVVLRRQLLLTWLFGQMRRKWNVHLWSSHGSHHLSSRYAVGDVHDEFLFLFFTLQVVIKIAITLQLLNSARF